jgi:hypothetical protein
VHCGRKQNKAMDKHKEKDQTKYFERGHGDRWKGEEKERFSEDILKKIRMHYVQNWRKEK